jgi:glycosyltransferase involved in cell wall biosynthesis
MKKFAVFSLGLPPSQSGQSIALYHLLKQINSTDYNLITLKNFYLYKNQGNCSKRLMGHHHFVNPDYQIIRVLLKLISFLRLPVLLVILLKIRKSQYIRILTQEPFEAVVGCTGDFFDPPSAFLASKELGIPFIFYTFDYYSRQWTDPVLQSFSEKYEAEIVNQADAIIVPNECMADEYYKKFGVSATVIHNPFDFEDYEKNIIKIENKKTSGIQIVYTGAVYDAHYSAFQNLIKAIEVSGIPNLKLHLYTPQLSMHLQKNGIIGPVIVHQSLPNNQMPAIQRNADILFLPLAFNTSYPEIIKTSAPGKIGEYLASKRPILVHAPKDSFVSWYFKKYNCGLVVDEDNPKLLAQAIERLIADEMLCLEITQNAYSRAREDFDIHIAQKKFNDVLDLQKGKRS